MPVSVHGGLWVPTGPVDNSVASLALVPRETQAPLGLRAIGRGSPHRFCFTWNPVLFRIQARPTLSRRGIWRPRRRPTLGSGFHMSLSRSQPRRHGLGRRGSTGASFHVQPRELCHSAASRVLRWPPWRCFTCNLLAGRPHPVHGVLPLPGRRSPSWRLPERATSHHLLWPTSNLFQYNRDAQAAQSLKRGRTPHSARESPLRTSRALKRRSTARDSD